MERSEIRRTLALASRGRTDAFRRLADPYVNLVTEAVTLADAGTVQSITNRSQAIFHDMWREIAAMRRVSDIERFLALAIQRLASDPVEGGRRDHLLGRLMGLGGIERTLVILRDMEGWELKRVSRALRLDPKDIDHWICRARCTMVDFGQPVDREEAQRILEISRRITEGNCCRHCIPKENGSRLRAFRDAWMEARSELIELRQDMRIEGRERDWFLDGLETWAEQCAPERLGPLPAIRNFFRFEPQLLARD